MEGDSIGKRVKAQIHAISPQGNLKKMNVVPKEFIRVMPDAMRAFVSEAFRKAGTSEADAAHMAHLLVLTDLRGVFSHGTWQTPGYVGMMLDGKVNPRPNVRCVDESPTTASTMAMAVWGILPRIMRRRRRSKKPKRWDSVPQRVGTTFTLGVLASIHDSHLKRIAPGLRSLATVFDTVPTRRLPLQLERRR